MVGDGPSSLFDIFIGMRVRLLMASEFDLSLGGAGGASQADGEVLANSWCMCVRESAVYGLTQQKSARNERHVGEFPWSVVALFFIF